MMYNHEELPGYVRTAGKITILTAISGLVIFVMAFLIDVGSKEFSKVSAQTATTTLTVLNTPPSFVVNAYETIESSTSSPTNSGDTITWSAVGSDSNGAPYFLLICEENATPTANAASGPGNLGTAPPECAAGVTQWGVSAGTVTDTTASVSTTTTEVAPFSEVQNWYAWVCDDDPNNPRCNLTAVQGFSATNSSPFNVNSRPAITDFSNNGPADPGATVNFYSTSTDPDTVGGEDTIFLVVCNSNTDYDTNLNTCPNDFIASTTISFTSDASATYTLPAIIRDDTYPAYGYIVDEHGHEATANPIQENFAVNNVAPVVLGGDITLNSGGNIVLTVPGDETTGFTLDFSVTDANSCLNAASSSEITNYVVSVFRSSYGTTTCDGSSGSYDPNYCYPSGIATSTWNLNCTPTACPSPLVDQIDFSCTFPLWFVADPTDSAPETPALFAADNWSVGVSGVDDNFATGTMATTTNGQELITFTALDLLTAEIPYGALEPGDDSGTLNATTSVASVGNTGLDQEVLGESMCGTYAPGNECPVSSTSTIPESEQQFASTSLAYGSPLALQLSSSTNQEVELNIPKTTSTSTPNSDLTYWGIAVPISITLAGSYSGLNTFTAATAEAIDW